MLVLTRERNGVVMIGHDIEVHVVDIGRDKVKLGFNAPKSVTVHRKEVYDVIEREKAKQAAKSR